MKLLTKELRKQLPQLYATEKEEDKLLICKFFTPDANWTWFAAEFDQEDTFFGLVIGFEREWGYFSLSELEQVRGPLGLPIERDLYFQPTRASALGVRPGANEDQSDSPPHPQGGAIHSTGRDDKDEDRS